MYFAIIGDIVESKKLIDRDGVQKRLNIILKDINIKFDNDIAAKFVITLGDEFQGLLSNPSNLFDIIDTIKFEMYPVRIRFGIGIGSIDTEVNSEMALGADGPAYHYARKIIEEIKRLNKANSKLPYNTDIAISMKRKNNVVDLINDNLCLCFSIEEKWTDKQRELIKEVRFINKTQRELADQLELAQSSIQRRLKGSEYYNYIHVKNNLKKILVEIWENENAD